MDNKVEEQTEFDETKRKCIGCGREIYKMVDICPYCETDNKAAKLIEDRAEEKMSKESPRDNENLAFKVYEEKPIEIDKYKKIYEDKKKKHSKEIPFFLIISIGLIIAAIFLLVNIINGTNSLNPNAEFEALSNSMSSVFLLAIFSIIGMALFFVVIKIIGETRKETRLFKNGVLLANLPYKVKQIDGPSNLYISRLEASYIDNEGNEIKFDFIKKDENLDGYTVIDVIYNPKNPKEYIDL